MTFQVAKRCPLCKHFDYQHGEYGCLAKRTRGTGVCNCYRTLAELVRERDDQRNEAKGHAN